MTSREPKCGNIGTLVDQRKFLDVKERTFYCKTEHNNGTDTSFHRTY